MLATAASRDEKLTVRTAASYSSTSREMLFPDAASAADAQKVSTQPSQPLLRRLKVVIVMVSSE